MAEKKTLIKKADSAVKTTESWMSFGTAIWEARGFFTPILIIGGAIVTAVSRIFSLGWEYVILASIPAVILATLIWLGLSWAWYMRPTAVAKRNNLAETAENRPNPPLTTSASPGIQFDKFELSTEQKVKNEVAYFKTFANEKIKAMKAELEREFEVLKKDNNKGIDTLFANKNLSDALKFGELAEIQDATAALYIIDPLTKKIQLEAKELFKIPLVDSWNYRFGLWVQDLRNWDSYSVKYAPKSYKPLFDFDPDMLRSEEWPDEVNGMEHNVALEYKKFRLYRSAFNANETKLLKRIRSIANRPFNGRGSSGEYISRFSD